MTLTTNSGTGLRANKSPQGLKLANSEFTAQPNEEVAAVDVYALSEPGVVTSITPQDNGSFLDKIQGALGSALNISKLPSLSGIKSATDALKSGMDKAQGILGMARDAAGAISRAQAGLNRVRNGGVMGALDVASNAAGALGYNLGPAVAAVRQGTNGINRGGIAGYASALDGITGMKGSPLSSLASNINSIDRAVDRVKGAGNLNSLLYSLDNASNTVGRTISSLDKVSQTDFYQGYNSILEKTKFSQEAYDKSNVGKVHTAMSDFVSTFSDGVSNVAAKAGTALGLASLGAEVGDTTVLSSLRRSGLDDRSTTAAATGLTTRAVETGNISLLKDIVYGDLLRDDGSMAEDNPLLSKPMRIGGLAVPNAVRGLAASLQPPSVVTPLKDIYNDLSSMSATLSQDWTKTTRAGNSILSTADFMDNDFMTSVFMAKSDDDHFQSRVGVTTVDLTTNLTEAQALMAAKVAVALNGAT